MLESYGQKSTINYLIP